MILVTAAIPSGIGYQTSGILNLEFIILNCYLLPYGSICLIFSELSLVISTAPVRRLLRVAFLPVSRCPFQPLRLMTLPVPVTFSLLAALRLVFNFILVFAFAISFSPSESQVYATSCMVTTEGRPSAASLIVHSILLFFCRRFFCLGSQ